MRHVPFHWFLPATRSLFRPYSHLLPGVERITGVDAEDDTEDDLQP